MREVTAMEESKEKPLENVNSDQGASGGSSYLRSGGGWDMLLLSSLIVGLVAHFAVVNLGAPSVLIVFPVYYVCILNRNFRFNLVQIIIGTAFAYSIAYFWPQLISLFKHQ
jgi:hypothetical protein